MTRTGALLVVDDNEANRDALSRRLRLRGYDVQVAADGAEALALVASERLDLVLLDVEMPGMSGLEVLTSIRAGRSDTELPVIMVTARTDGPGIVEAFRLGANDYVTKPVDFPVALARIGTHLSRKWTVEDLRESEERYALALRGANDGLWDWNLATNTVHWSARWKAMLGYGETEIGSTPDEWLSRVHPEDIGGVREKLAAHLASGAGHFESQHRLRHQDDNFRWVLCRGAAVRNGDGIATRLAGSLTDITATKLADPLTGLPNRILFFDLVERAIKRSERRPGCVFALLVLGLDRFDVIRDSLGPLTADRLLVEVAHRLQGALRAGGAATREHPEFTLARAGGDEFDVLLDDVADAHYAVRVAQRLRLALEEPFEVDGHQVFITATTGIAVSTTGYDQPQAVLRDATTALNLARANATTPYEIFDPAMRERAVARLRKETDLRQAVDTESFELHYQPIVSFVSGRIEGFEALLRWHHPEQGLVSAADFIPLAEDTGMILDIGRYSLIESCRRMADWRQRLGPAAPLFMSVNLSSRQLGDPDVVDTIVATLEAAGLPAASLRLEITESALLGDMQRAQATLSRFQSLGIACSLDDFGTGYSSLSYLQQLHVNTLKVDRSFVNRLGTGPSGRELVRAIVTLAHNLGMDVIAEGVETAEQYAELRALGCEYAQGFYLSRAVDSARAEQLILSQPWCATSISGV